MRAKQGNTLAITLATTLIVVALIIFGLWYTSINTASTISKAQVESAALAAAMEISRIVVNTPECGYVGLVSMGPMANAAPDNWNQQVRGINDLMATARLDLIIAKESNDPFMKALALKDRDNVLKAKDQLVAAIQQSLTPGGSSKDINGTPVTAYDRALSLYLSNPALKSSYIPGSMKISLGVVDGGSATGVPIPQGSGQFSISPNQQIGGFYRSDTNITFDGVDFVFGAIGSRVALVDGSSFKENGGNLPIFIPAVVKVEAAQKYEDQGRQQTLYHTACATTGGTSAKTPVPGAFTVSFPDGPMDELTKLADLGTYKEMDDTDADVLTSTGGDFPVDRPNAVMSPATPWPTPPWTKVPVNCDLVYRLCLYDWIRACGPYLNPDAVKVMLQTPFETPNPPMTKWISLDINLLQVDLGLVNTGILHIYTLNPDGTIAYRSKVIKPEPYMVAADDQLYAENLGGDSIKSKTKDWSAIKIRTVDPKSLKNVLKKIKPRKEWDVYFRDLVHQPGVKQGGDHVGEPIDNFQYLSLLPGDFGKGGQGAGTGTGLPPMVSEQTDFALSTLKPSPTYQQYSEGPSGGAPRPTYTKNGTAVEIKFRRQIDIKELRMGFGRYRDITDIQDIDFDLIMDTEDSEPWNVGYIGVML